MLEYAIIRAYFIWINEMAETTGNQEYEAISLELRDMKDRINQLASAIGQDVRVLKEKNLKDLTLTGLVADYPLVQIDVDDDGVTALGKLQKQILAVEGDIPEVDYGNVLTVKLTGLVFDDKGQITATDTVLQAFGKLQAQVSDIDPVNEFLEGFTVATELDTIQDNDSTLTAFGKTQKWINELDLRADKAEYGFGLFNLMLNTENPTAAKPLQFLNGSVMTPTGMRIDYSENQDYIVLEVAEGDRYFSFNDIPNWLLERGDTYTLSFRIRGGIPPVVLSMHHFDGSTWHRTEIGTLEFVNEWFTLNTFSFKVPDNAEFTSLRFDVNNATIGGAIAIEHSSFKCERGFVHNDWTPALSELASPNLSESIHAILTPFVAATEIESVLNTDSILTALQKIQKYGYDAYWKAVYIEDNYAAASKHEVGWDDNANDKNWEGVFHLPEDWRGEKARNFPTWEAGVMVVSKHDDFALILQEYTTYASLKKWIRSFNGTKWTAWKVVLA